MVSINFPTGSSEGDLFTREVFLPPMYELMAPFLPALQFSTFESVGDSDMFSYRQVDESIVDDPMKEIPVTYSVSADIPEVQISYGVTKSGSTSLKAISFRMDRKAVRRNVLTDDLARTVKRIGAWLAQDLNKTMMAVLNDNARQPTWSPKSVWSADNCQPVADIVSFVEEMQSENRPYAATDVFVNRENFRELRSYLAEAGIEYTKQKDMYGVPNPQSNMVINVPLADVTVYGLWSGVAEGSIMAVDRTQKPLSMFYFNDPKYSIPTFTYPPNKGGTGLGRGGSETVIPNIGLNMDIYEEQRSKDTVMQFWFENAVVCKDPYSVIRKTGI